MKASKQLAKQFREVFLDGKWIALTNLKEQLADVNWQQATTKIGSLNTIAALTFHLNYYVAGVLEFLEGGELTIRDKFSFDMPPIESEVAWKALVDKSWDDAERFAQCVENMSDEQLDATFVDEKYGDYRRNIYGIIEHSYYHFGQIVLIKKLVLEQNNKG